ncbi:MAG TPA: SDR family NAD(P)-dependent oxidoreductase, partial [Flavobacterium sp.]|nr:SDR family NAD(P)-dependent oxidoreductase [Flavobacterium sp.]
MMLSAFLKITIMTDLKNKNAFITGAGKGIGKAVAIALAKEGVNLILVSRTQKDVEQLADEASNLGVKAL